MSRESTSARGREAVAILLVLDLYHSTLARMLVGLAMQLRKDAPTSAGWRREGGRRACGRRGEACDTRNSSRATTAQLRTFGETAERTSAG